MLAIDTCSLPATGSSMFVVAAGLFMLIAGAVVTHWVRASSGRMSVVVAPLVLLGGLVLAPSATNPCVTPTTVAPLSQNLVLEIDTSLSAPIGANAVSITEDGFVYELGLWGDVDVQIDWGDGFTDDVMVSGPFAHTYTASGRYTITVSGSLTGFGQDPEHARYLIGQQYLTAVRSFGELGITSFAYAFLASVNLIDVPSNLSATVTDMSAMFFGASSLNQSLDSWDTGLVTNMSAMFGQASSFNGDVSQWHTGSVTDMSLMFAEASAFDGDVSNWDTGSVRSMRGMFGEASSFNGDVSQWHTGSVMEMTAMFYQATSFNRSLGTWDISEVADMRNMLDGSALSVDNYDATLNGWAGLPVWQPSIFLGADGLHYSDNGAVSHYFLTGRCGGPRWQITDAGYINILNPTSLNESNEPISIAC